MQVLSIKPPRKLDRGEYIVIGDQTEARVVDVVVGENKTVVLAVAGKEKIKEVFSEDQHVVVVGPARFTTKDPEYFGTTRVVFKSKHGKPGEKAGFSWNGSDAWVITNEFEYNGERHVVAELPA